METIEQNPFLTTADIAEILNSRQQTISDHIRQLELVQKYSKWVPHHLKENLLDYYIEHNDRTWKFLHDNPHIYCGNRVKQFTSKNLIEIMDSPSYSPDLNPIENVWSYIVKIIHESRRQFHCIKT